MPVIKLQHIVSSSSEDTTHKADNLLKPETYRKWKCAEGAERKASVILQFEKATQIHSIDIGNESSAFVEVLVGHATSNSPDDYQVILVTSSFMSPMDSKNCINTNRVRMFGPDKLSKAVSDKKWDRVKVVCSQPFNKLISYGLSFIKFHSPQENNEEPTSSTCSQAEQQSQTANKLGKFRLKEETKSTLLTAGSFFKQRSITKTEQAPLTGAAAVRAAATLAAASLSTSVTTSQASVSSATATTNQIRPSNNSTNRQLDTQSDKPHKAIQKRRLSDNDVAPSQRQGGNTQTAASRRSSADKEERRTTAPPSKKSRDNEEETSRKKRKPFERLMEGVTFVLSGFQNPLRGDLRDKAMEMGAKYKPDWGKGCTHLICAFANTPKFNQVQGKGKIVTKGWILDSYKKKLLHPWKRYSMLSASDDSSSYEEESETDEDDWEPTKKRKPSPQKTTPKKTTPKDASTDQAEKNALAATSGVAEEKRSPKPATVAADDGCSTTDIDSDDAENAVKFKSTIRDEISSEGDTEDEVRRIQEYQEDGKSSSKDPYDSSTDEEVDNKTTNPGGASLLSTGIPDLPEFFAGKTFFLYGEFDAEERRQLTRLIIAFEGSVEDYMTDEVTFVITNSQWDDNFDKALSDHPGLSFVRSKWIYACSEKSKMVPYQPYVVVPS